MATEGDGEILGVTADGTAIIFAGEDVEEVEDEDADDQEASTMAEDADADTDAARLQEDAAKDDGKEDDSPGDAGTSPHANESAE